MTVCATTLLCCVLVVCEVVTVRSKRSTPLYTICPAVSSTCGGARCYCYFLMGSEQGLLRAERGDVDSACTRIFTYTYVLKYSSMHYCVAVCCVLLYADALVTNQVSSLYDAYVLNYIYSFIIRSHLQSWNSRAGNREYRLSASRPLSVTK